MWRGGAHRDDHLDARRSVNLTGTWVSDDYDCPWGVAHTEVVTIIQDGDRITGTKVTGDDCVPAGEVTFSGVLRADSETVSVSWVVGHPHAPASGRHPGTITIASPNLLLATAPGWREMRFRRVELDVPWR